MSLTGSLHLPEGQVVEAAGSGRWDCAEDAEWAYMIPARLATFALGPLTISNVTADLVVGRCTFILMLTYAAYSADVLKDLYVMTPEVK